MSPDEQYQIEQRAARDVRIAELAARLPAGQAERLAAAVAAVRAFNAAILAADDAGADSAGERYAATLCAMNGGRLFGCCAGDEAPGAVVQRHCAAVPGTVPSWGQAGEFLLTVGAVRAVVRHFPEWGYMRARLDFHALDGRPFVSATGFRSHYCREAAAGVSVEQAARALLIEFAAQGLHCPEVAGNARSRWAWLQPAADEPTTYREDSGQFAMSF